MSSDEEQDSVEAVEIGSAVPFLNEAEELIWSESPNYSNMDYNIKYCVKQISRILNDFHKANTEQRHVMKHRILSLCKNLTLKINLYWTTVSKRKDSVSYQFSKRIFPEMNSSDFSNKKEKALKSSKKKKVRFVDEIGESEDKSKKEKTKLLLKETERKIPAKAIKTDLSESHEKSHEKSKKSKKTEKTENVENTKSQGYEISDSLLDKICLHYIDENSPGTHKPLAPEDYYSTINQDTINEIFSKCLENDLYSVTIMLYCVLASSQEFCHLVMNNEYVTQSLFRYDSWVRKHPEYIKLLHYFMFYSMYILYKEECIVRSGANGLHRFVMSLNNISSIPSYEGPLKLNPFLTLTLSDRYIYSQDVQLDKLIIKPIMISSSRGLYSIESFKERFDVFTGGVFKYVNFNKIYPTGSCIPACLMRSPQELLFGIKMPRDLDESKSTKKIKKFWKSNKEKLENYFNEYFLGRGIFREQYFTDDFKTYRPIIDESLSDIDCIIDARDVDDFDNIAKSFFEQVRKAVIENKDSGLWPSDEVNILKKTSGKKYRYLIYGMGLPRNIEIFRCSRKDKSLVSPAGTVSRFHFPCVRAYFTGTDVMILPSAVSSSYGIGISYKWLSTNKITEELICKYFTRGHSILLNENEHEAIYDFVKKSEKWKHLLKAVNGARSISINNPVFRPRLKKVGLWYNLKSIEFKGKVVKIKTKKAVESEYVNDDPKFEEEWMKVDSVDTSKFGFTFDIRHPSGYIIPPQLWKAEAYVSEILAKY